MELFITDYGTPKLVADKLFASGEAAIDLMQPMSEIVLDLFRVEKAIFDSGGRRGGGSWKQLKPNTIDKKGNTQILKTEGSYPKYRSGKNLLFRSLTEPGAPFQTLNMHREGFEFGTYRPYAFVHQHGSAKRGIPARPFIKYSYFDYIRWNNIISRHLVRAFEATNPIPGE